MKKISLSFDGFSFPFTIKTFYTVFPFLTEMYEFIESNNPDFYILGSSKEVNGKSILLFSDEQYSHTFIIGSEINQRENYIRIPDFYYKYNLLGIPLDFLFDKERIYSPVRFCSFIQRNHSEERETLFNLLNSYKTIHSPSSFMNNSVILDHTFDFLPSPLQRKIAYQRQFKFSLNVSRLFFDGNTGTIVDSMISKSIPIFWGNKKINQEFNQKSFINVHSFQSLDDLLYEIKELDMNENKFKEVYNQPWFIDNKVPQSVRKSYLQSQFKRMFD